MGKSNQRRQPTPPAPARATPTADAGPSPSPAPEAPRPAPAPRSWLGLKITGCSVALLWLTWLAYANSFTAGLTLDNEVLIGENLRLKEWNTDNLRLILEKNYWWPTYESDLYRPLTTLSYMFNYAVLGEGANVWGYHLINFLLHWANACLVLIIIRRLSGKLGLALVAAALFAVHPVNVESVTNIVGRADLLATLSIFLGGWCYLRAAEARGWRKAAWLCGTGLNLAWGIFAKESAPLLCLFIALYDWLWRWPQLPGNNFWRRLRVAAWEFGVKGYTALVPGLLMLWAVRHWLTFNSPVFGQIYVDNPIVGATSWFQGAMTAIKVIGRYLALLVYPATLSNDYSYHQIPLFHEPGHPWQDFLAWVALAVVALLLWAALRLRRSWPLFSWGAAFFFLMQLPTANLFFPIGSIMAERFLYLPSVGFCVVAALAFSAATTRWRAAWALPILAVAALAVRTHVRNADWQSNLTLWKSAMQACPDSFKTWKGYASAVWDSGHTEEHVDQAIALTQTSLAILDKDFIPLSLQDETLYLDLGQYYAAKANFLMARGEQTEARDFYHRAVDIILRAKRVDEWVNLASHRSWVERGRKIGDLAEVVGNHRIYLMLGTVYYDLGMWPECEAAARYVERLQPTEAMGYRLMGTACANSGQLHEAAVQFIEALYLDPNDDETFQNLARCYAQLGQQPLAVQKNAKGYVLNQAVPMVRQDLNEAGVALVDNFLRVRQMDSANYERDYLIKNIHVPPELFQQP
jgi:protein O-mannosyl-transferase